jgi:hypothetical protein
MLATANAKANSTWWTRANHEGVWKCDSIHRDRQVRPLLDFAIDQRYGLVKPTNRADPLAPANHIARPHWPNPDETRMQRKWTCDHGFECTRVVNKIGCTADHATALCSILTIM